MRFEQECNAIPVQIAFSFSHRSCQPRLVIVISAWVNTGAVGKTTCDLDRNHTTLLFKSHGILFSATRAHPFRTGSNHTAKVSVLSIDKYLIKSIETHTWRYKKQYQCNSNSNLLVFDMRLACKNKNKKNNDQSSDILIVCTRHILFSLINIPRLVISQSAY